MQRNPAVLELLGLLLLQARSNRGKINSRDPSFCRSNRFLMCVCVIRVLEHSIVFHACRLLFPLCSSLSCFTSLSHVAHQLLIWSSVISLLEPICYILVIFNEKRHSVCSHYSIPHVYWHYSSKNRISLVCVIYDFWWGRQTFIFTSVDLQIWRLVSSCFHANDVQYMSACVFRLAYEW